jgi:hypothetical protein
MGNALKWLVRQKILPRAQPPFLTLVDKTAQNTIDIASEQFSKLMLPMIEATFFMCLFIVMTVHEVALLVDQVL